MLELRTRGAPLRVRRLTGGLQASLWVPPAAERHRRSGAPSQGKNRNAGFSRGCVYGTRRARLFDAHLVPFAKVATTRVIGLQFCYEAQQEYLQTRDASWPTNMTDHRTGRWIALSEAQDARFQLRSAHTERSATASNSRRWFCVVCPNRELISTIRSMFLLSGFGGAFGMG
jgi:hypothetical protein